jgi:hypothetical protein
VTIRVNDPTVVTVSFTVKDLSTIKSIVEKATAAATGVVFTPEEKAAWQDLLLRYEEATKRQLFIYQGRGEG